MTPHPPEDGSRPDAGDVLPEARVHAVLRRAAQLQAEAAERLEREARARIHAGEAAGGRAEGFRREELEAAAAGAGISPDFVRQALVEQDALGEHAAELAPWVDRLGHRMLGSRQRSLELSRRMAAPPQAVLDAMGRVLPAHPYFLSLVDSLGGPPLEGGVMVFAITRITAMGSGAITPFTYAAAAVDLLQVHATVHPDGEGGTRVSLRGDLRTSTRRNVWAGLALSGLGGGGGAAVAAAVAMAAGALLPVAAGAALAGAAATGVLSAKGYGLAYRRYLRRMTAELETLLRTVDTHARTGGAFRPPQPPGRGDGGDDVLGLLGAG